MNYKNWAVAIWDTPNRGYLVATRLGKPYTQVRTDWLKDDYLSEGWYAYGQVRAKQLIMNQEERIKRITER